ncbi:MAG: hypothetical protein FJ318_10325 [SAR202 cluster bacterium]|nr:hypothetical protein [SAR202 cluster bacterium]
MQVVSKRGAMWAAVLALVGLLALAGCQGEDRPGSVTVDANGTPTSGSVSSSNSGIGNAGGNQGGTASPTAALYTPVSNVDAYFQWPVDRADILAEIAEGDWAGARAIYENGKNFVRADGTLRSLKSAATDPNVLAMFPNGPQVYGSEQFIDGIIAPALTGTGMAAGLPDGARRQMVDKGLQMALYGKALQELASARTRLQQGNTDNATGVPHVVDEAAAIILGAPNAEGVRSYSLSATARSREANFGLQGAIDTPLQVELTRLLQAAQRRDLAAYDEARDRVLGYLNAIFYLATLRYGTSAVNAAVGDRLVPLYEGWTFFQTIRATVAQASSSGADRIAALYTSDPATVTDAVPQEIYGILNQPAVLDALRIPPHVVVTKAP